MPFNPDTGFYECSADPQLAARIQRLADLGLGAPDPVFDQIAAELAHNAGAAYAFVNFVTDQQRFAGLYGPDGTRLPTAAATTCMPAPVGRTMALDEGFCPEVIERGHSLVLCDVYDSPRAAFNPVVEQLGVRRYVGAPLIDTTSGITLGTVCFIDTAACLPEQGKPDQALIEATADQAMQVIHQRFGAALR